MGSLAVSAGLGVSGMYEERPGLSEAIMQALGYIPMVPQHYDTIINKAAQKFRKYKPTVTDSSGNVILRPKAVLQETKPGKLVYRGESYGGPVKKDVFSRLGAKAPLQDNTKIEIKTKDGKTWVYDMLSEVPTKEF